MANLREVALIFQTEQNRPFAIAETGHVPFMVSGAKMLSPDEFTSLLAVGNARENFAAPMVPAEHSARLIALGYMVDLAGRLRMTTPGRIRIYAGQLAN